MSPWLWALAGLATGLLLLRAPARYAWATNAGTLLGLAGAGLALALLGEPPRASVYLLLVGLALPSALAHRERPRAVPLGTGAGAAVALALLPEVLLAALALGLVLLAAAAPGLRLRRLP